MASPYNMAFACLDCHKSFKRGFNLAEEYPVTLTCPNCGGNAHNLGRHFKAPKRTDKKQWAKVQFLLEYGFFFQKIYDNSNAGELVPYPDTLEQAKEFVVKYKAYAVQRNI